MSTKALGCTVRGCSEAARWYVWFKGSGGLYTYRCDAHLKSEQGVSQVTLIETQR